MTGEFHSPDSLLRALIASLVRYVLGPLLMIEALVTSVWIARHLSGLMARDAVTIAIVVARGLVGALALVSGMWLIDRRPIGAATARVALVASAVLTTLELGWRLAPSNLDPAWRWPVVAGSWIYAAVWLIVLGRSTVRETRT